MRLPRVRRLPRAAEIFELVRLWGLLWAADFRLVFFPGSWNRRWLFRESSGLPGAPRFTDEIPQLVRLLRVASRLRFRQSNPCLTLSLALRWRLESLGLSPRLAYGVRKSSSARGAIDAHAWLVLGDQIIDAVGEALSYQEFRR